MVILKSLKFWTLVVGLLVYILHQFIPAWPTWLAWLDETTILNIVLFLLGLFGIVPEVRAAKAARAFWQTLAFWQAVAGFFFGVIHFLFPDWAITSSDVLGVLLAILAFFGITPELRARSLLK